MNATIEYPAHKYTGALAMIQLHERHMRSCVATWHRAKAAGLTLPETDDPDYKSMDALLYHIIACARGYMVWMCEKLEFPDPGIEATPGVASIAAEADTYLDHVLDRWRHALVDLVPEKSYRPSFETRWKTPANIESMLEHAVMHPVRHEYQLETLLAAR